MEPKDIIYNKWIKCSDNNYWQTEHDIVLCPMGGEVYIHSMFIKLLNLLKYIKEFNNFTF